MSKIKFLIFMGLVAALVVQAPVAALAAAPILPGIQGPGGVPHYFGPYGNWAYSPLPTGNLNTALTVDSPGTGYSASPVVTVNDAYDSTKSDTATAIVVGDAITAITLNAGGSGGIGYSAPVVTITDSTGTGAAATATLNLTSLSGGLQKFVNNLPQLGPAGANNIIQAHGAGQYIPVGIADTAAYPAVVGPPAKPASDYYEIALVEFSEKMHRDLPPTRLRGYVQLETPGTLAAMAAMVPPVVSKHVDVGGGLFAIDNPHYLGPTIVAYGNAHGVADPAGQPKPVRIKFINLLPKGPADPFTGLRPGDLFLPVDETVMGSGYGPGGPGIPPGEKYTQNRATIHLHGNNTVWISDGNTHQWITPAGERTADNSAATPYPKGVSVRNVPDMGTACDAPGSGCLTFFYTNAQSARLMFYHDHAMGITRLNVYAGEAAGYVITNAVELDMIKGTNVSGVNIAPGTATPFKKVLPDIGIPLVIQDRTWVDANTIFAQDPTWNWGTGPRGATGNITEAVTGDLWFPHVYMSAQMGAGGINPFGRWHYGPWFNPPTPECVNGLPVGCIEVGPVPNEYYQPDCGLVPPGPGCTTPWEPPTRPGVPNPSIPGEAFMDTPVVNGTAYPYLEVEPKAYRFRVLNASNDRVVNLQLYVAADKTTPTTPNTTGTVLCTGPAPSADPARSAYYANCTEVKMVPVSVAPANQYADWPSGIPDSATKGPDWWQIGTEGGFLPKPVVVPQQPVGWNLDATTFNFGVVNQHSLLVGSAERADVVVDFSAYAGKTLILYNDAPAAFPAGVATYDYFTGVANQMDAGGAPTTQPGYGPNTRTIMQIRVAGTVTGPPTPDVTLANLQAVFAKGDTSGCALVPQGPCKHGVFEVSQEPIILPQADYNSAYNNTFPATDAAQYFSVADTAKTFKPIDENGVLSATAVTLPLEMKAMHDEMGGVYDTQFGRMSGMLGLTNPTSPVHVLIPYGYASPPTDLVKGSVEGTPIGVMPDGTQIWRIFHNGVDTHTIHTHLFHAQLINRISQDATVLMPPDPEELGWKDTFRVNPLEITFLAMRPTVPTPAQLPFEVPDSVRLIDPTLPEGATLIPPPPAGWFDPDGVAITEILNHFVNFGWEYVWHCHILAHEEMDMMHTLVFAVPPREPSLQLPVLGGTANNPRVTLNWTDNSIKETQFTIQRASDVNFTTGLRTFTVAAAAGSGTAVTYTDTTVSPNNNYWYRVYAIGAPVGDTQAYPGSLGFPTMSADSVSGPQTILVGAAPGTPNAPTNLTAALQTGPQVSLTWRDNATNETGFVVERCSFVAPAATTCSNFAQIATPGPRNNTGNVTYVDTTVTFGNSYLYRVAAVNSASPTPLPLLAYVTLTDVNAVGVPAIPAAPATFTVAVVKANGNNYTATLNWGLPIGAPNPTNFTIQRATNLDFTAGLTTSTVAGNLRTTTQTVTKNTTYYYRIRANNNVGGSSAWKNALSFPIRTGN